MIKILFAFAVTIIPSLLIAQKAGKKFIWAVASASYQVEGAYQADGKGLSNWDVYTNTYHITRPLTGQSQTGNVAINAYDRTQYLKDIALMKQLGVNTYRFSISWTRIFPTGTGEVNQKGIDHYNLFIDDLLANGIEPMVTLFHWDLPQALQEQGGWLNPKSVQWFEDYANIIFNSFGKKVKKYITFNEPYIDNFLLTPIIKNVIEKKKNPVARSPEQLAERATATHHLLLANAVVTRDYHQKNLGGSIGITLSLSPTIPLHVESPEDMKAATIMDGMLNRWFLDALYKGKYPDDILAIYQQYNKDLKPTAEDYKLFADNKPDFLGINYYAPVYSSANKYLPFGVTSLLESANPDSVQMYNGPVRPEYLYKLLMRLKKDYNSPPMIITENGAGFGAKDDSLVNGKVNDVLRIDYIKRHIAAAMKAKKDGVNLQGYTLWSIFDNFEWIFGYNRRFGIVFINYETQERIPKQSFYTYQEIIKSYR
ncbi:MAG: family 1 glycosylhydrolase [Ferruginibacter sp.]